LFSYNRIQERTHYFRKLDLFLFVHGEVGTHLLRWSNSKGYCRFYTRYSDWCFLLIYSKVRFFSSVQLFCKEFLLQEARPLREIFQWLNLRNRIK